MILDGLLRISWKLDLSYFERGSRDVVLPCKASLTLAAAFSRSEPSWAA